MTPRRPRLRTAAGTILVVVVAVMILLVIFAVSMGVRSQEVTVRSAKALFHERCESLASMAIVEAAHALRISANEEGSPAFFLFRKQDPGAEIAFAPEELPRAQREIERYPAYNMGYGVEASVVRRAAIGLEQEERVPYEAVGVLRFEVTVHGPESTQVKRIDEYGFRSVLTAPPRPLDMTTFFLFDPAELLKRGAYQDHPNATIVQFAKRLADWKEVVQQLTRVNVQGIGGDAQALLNSWPAQDWKHFKTTEKNTTNVPGELHEFDWPISVFSADDSVDLEKLNLPARIERPVDEIEAREPQIRQVHQELQALTGMGQAALSRIRPIYDRLKALIVADATQIEEVFTAYKEFQDILIEVAGNSREELAKRVRRLNADEQRWKAHYTFEGKGKALEAARFLNQDPPPNGVVYVNDPDNDLIVDIQDRLRGRLAITCMGNMTVKRAVVDREDQDLIVLTGYRNLEIEGEVTAAIVSWGSGYRGTGNPFKGSLVLYQIPSGIDASNILKGQIQLLPTVLSGEPGDQNRDPPYEKSKHIALGPTAIWRKTSYDG